MNRKAKRAFLIAGILLFAVVGAIGLGTMKPPPQTKDVPDPAPLVSVMTLESFDTEFRIASQGTVNPRTETILSAEISGAIVSISPKFIPGGVFASGEELLRIDPTNYVAAVDRTEATLIQRQIEFDGAEKLRSQGYRAESEYASAVAALAGARADLVNAQRNLQRTRISLPYDGMIRTKEADLGQYVNTGTKLGITFATDYAEVRLPLTDQDLAFIDLPDAADIRASGSAAGPLVTLSAVQKGQMRSWQARIVRTEGIVDEKSRVTYAVARVEDPYRLRTHANVETPLPMGTFVAADIAGLQVSNVVRVPRTALRSNNQLMVVDSDDTLRIRNVDVLRSDAEFAYLESGAVAGERVFLTTIESPLNGMKVRTQANPARHISARDQRVADADAN
jgi:RND family efflux transporter MFP subunit